MPAPSAPRVPCPLLTAFSLLALALRISFWIILGGFFFSLPICTDTQLGLFSNLFYFFCFRENSIACCTVRLLHIFRALLNNLPNWAL